MKTIWASIVLILAAATASAQLIPSMGDPAMGDYPSLKISGFTDLDFHWIDQHDSTTSGFSEGQFVLHFASALSPRISFFGELSMTAKNGSFSLAVERTIIRFDQSDKLKLSFGRYHTPINWWNTAFHHGQWLQTSVSRPEMTKFGGKFIPVHFVGGLVEGEFPAGGLNLGYKAGLGNGRSTSISGAGDSGDSNNNRAWLLNLSVRPDRLYPLEAGTAYYQDKVPVETHDVDEKIYSAFVVWPKETPEVLTEWAHVEHQDGGTKWKSDAWYAQLAYRLPFDDAKWKPYARYESIEIDENDPSFGKTITFPRDGGGDPVFSTLSDLKGWIGGIRYDIASTVAIKVEYRHQKPGKEDYVNALYAQISFAF